MLIAILVLISLSFVMLLAIAGNVNNVIKVLAQIEMNTRGYGK